MIIDRENRFVFIHNAKAAGTSMSAAFIPNRHINRPRDIPPPSDSRFHLHSTLNEILLCYPECKDYHTFTFVRNPWERFISYYCSLYQTGDIETLRYKLLMATKPLSMDVLRQQIHYLPGLSFLGRYERLQDDFKLVCNQVNITANLPHKNASKKDRSYQYYYDESLYDLVGTMYADDIRTLGYKF